MMVFCTFPLNETAVILLENIKEMCDLDNNCICEVKLELSPTQTRQTIFACNIFSDVFRKFYKQKIV